MSEKDKAIEEADKLENTEVESQVDTVVDTEETPEAVVEGGEEVEEVESEIETPEEPVVEEITTLKAARKYIKDENKKLLLEAREIKGRLNEIRERKKSLVALKKEGKVMNTNDKITDKEVSAFIEKLGL